MVGFPWKNGKGMVHMMVSIQSYVRRGRRIFRQLAGNARLMGIMQGAAYLAAGFLLSAAMTMPVALILHPICTSIEAMGGNTWKE